MNHEKNPGRRAFTLVELLVVLAVVALLMSILVPLTTKGIRRARCIQCLGNLKEIGRATVAYVEDNGGYLPAYATKFSGGGSRALWYTELRPYIRTDAEIKVDRSDPRYAQHGINLPEFYCPSVSYEEAYPHTHYGYNYAVAGWQFWLDENLDQYNRRRFLSISEPAATILFMEHLVPGSARWPKGGWQTVPRRLEDPAYFPKERHDGLVNAAFCDGHAESIPWQNIHGNLEGYFPSLR